MTARNFAEYLAELMQRRNLIPAQIAAYAQVGASTVVGWQRGSRPKPESLQKLADALGEDLGEMARAAGYPVVTQTNVMVEPPPAGAEVAMQLTGEEAAFIQFLRRMREELHVSVKRVQNVIGGMLAADDELFYDWSGDKDEARERARDSGASP